MNKKIIRDKYIDIIKDKELSTCKGDTTKSFILLNEKIDEELKELKETAFNDVKEWADVFEILERMAQFQGISIEEINKARKIKIDEKGKFENLITLEG